MFRILTIAFILLAASAFAQDPAVVPDAAPVKAPPLPTLKVPVVKEPPKIDGVLDDAAWKLAAQGEASKLMLGGDAKGRTRFYVARDDEKLYVAVECFDDPEALKNLVAKTLQHDGGPIWEDDCVELFIDPSNQRQSYFQLIINSKNVTWDCFHQTPGAANGAWEAAGEHAVKVGDRSWVAEFALPFPSFALMDEWQTDWAFNLSRTRKTANELTFWSPVMCGSSHTPARFGTLTNMPKTEMPEAAPRPQPRPPVPPEAALLDFEDPADADAWSMLKLPEVKAEEPSAKVELSDEHATAGKRSLKITFDGGEWPAVATKTLKLPGNVFDYQSLKLDVTASRPCLVAVRILQEKSEEGLGWSAAVTRWNATASLSEGKNEITRKLPGRADWEALSPKFGKITTLAVMMYHPQKGDTIWVDNIRLSTERVWPKLTTFKVLGTNLSVSGVEELGAKLNGDWKKPEAGTADELEAEMRAKLDDLKKTHPAAVLAVFREGQAGFDPKNAAKAFSGWADTHVNAHSPDGPNEGRTQVSGGYDRIEAFMRHRSALMRIDLSSIPAGSEILAARLVIQGEGTGSFSGPPEKVPVPVPPGDRPPFPEDGKTEPVPNMWAAEACNRPWVEGEANGYEYAKGKYWRQTGGMDWDGDDPDFLPLFVAHGPSQGPTSWWDFTEAVKFWTAGSHPNHGFMLHGTGSPYMHMFTKEHKDLKLRPALYVIYEPK